MLWRKQVTKKMDRVIAPSQYIKDVAVMNGIPGDRIEVVPHFTGKNLEKEWVEPEENTILFVGRTDPLKGISELIKALSLIKGQWKAYIVGTGEGLEAYEDMAKGLGIRDRVVFSNNIGYADLDDYYKKASVVVFPSMSQESFGLVGIEAMSFGRPVVAFDVGGPREWLVDGETGFLVARGDVGKLAFSIGRLLEDKGLAFRMGEKAMECVNERFRREHHLNRLMEVYEKAIRDRRTAKTP